MSDGALVLKLMSACTLALLSSGAFAAGLLDAYQAARQNDPAFRRHVTSATLASTRSTSGRRPAADDFDYRQLLEEHRRTRVDDRPT
jgi:hypothetical protein